jgi:hypothetical protein
VINFLPPALARYPGGVMDKFGPPWFFGIPTVLTLFVLIGDTWKHRKLNKIFLLASIFLIASLVAAPALSSTDAWR